MLPMHDVICTRAKCNLGTMALFVSPPGGKRLSADDVTECLQHVVRNDTESAVATAITVSLKYPILQTSR